MFPFNLLLINGMEWIDNHGALFSLSPAFQKKILLTGILIKWYSCQTSSE